MSTNDRFPPMVAGEKHVLTFQTDDELATGETLTGSPTVTVEVRRGTDATPAALVTASSYDAGAKNVLVKVHPTIKDVDYEIRVIAPTSNADKVLGRIGYLYVD